MQKVKGIIWMTSLFVLFYAITPHIGVKENIIFSLFLVSNILLIYMVYAILVKGTPSKKKFSEGDWYDDINRTYSKDT